MEANKNYFIIWKRRQSNPHCLLPLTFSCPVDFSFQYSLKKNVSISLETIFTPQPRKGIVNTSVSGVNYSHPSHEQSTWHRAAGHFPPQYLPTA